MLMLILPLYGEPLVDPRFSSRSVNRSGESPFTSLFRDLMSAILAAWPLEQTRNTNKTLHLAQYILKNPKSALKV